MLRAQELQSSARILGVSETIILGYADVADPSWAAHIECLKAHKPFKDFQFERAGAAGDIRHVSVSGAPVFDENGVFTGYRGSGRDITQEVEAERTLRAALERAEAANRAKSEFLTNMSHELRTPLNAIIGFSELIVTEAVGPVPSQYTSFATDILASGRHLLDLINELLDMSKIEAGQYTLSEEPIDLAPFVRSCMGTVEPKAREGDVALTYQPGLENVVLQADRKIGDTYSPQFSGNSRLDLSRNNTTDCPKFGSNLRPRSTCFGDVLLILKQ